MDKTNFETNDMCVNGALLNIVLYYEDNKISLEKVLLNAMQSMQSDRFHINTKVMRNFYWSSYVLVLMKFNGKYHVSTVISKIFCAI